MTPKEKAEELIFKFKNSQNSDGYNDVRDIEAAKRCALIAVDEIISSREDDSAFNDTMSYNGSDYYTPHPMYLTYWKQVKQEIDVL